MITAGSNQKMESALQKLNKDLTNTLYGERLKPCPNLQCRKPTNLNYSTCSHCGAALGAYNDVVLLECLDIIAERMMQNRLFNDAAPIEGYTLVQMHALTLRFLIQELESSDLPRSGSPTFIAGMLVARAASSVLQSIRERKAIEGSGEPAQPCKNGHVS